MPKPVFNPAQYELRNEIPLFLSEEQQQKVSDTTTRVNDQLNWVAQILGWNGDNYWTTLTETTAQKRALLSGTYGVFNSYTILPIYEVQAGNNLILTEKRPNVELGQRVIVGNLQSYIYSVEDAGDYFQISIGDLESTGILALLQQGAALKVDVPENRPFPFYRPEALASGDAYFRCTTGKKLPSRSVFNRVELVLYPYSQENTVVPYQNLELYGGSYYYFDREVYLSQDHNYLVPWITPEFVQEKGLWKLFVCPSAIGQEVTLVWNYPDPRADNLVASCPALVVPWKDPSDWGVHGESFNPVLDDYIVTKNYRTPGLNYSLGTKLWLGDLSPLNSNPLWYDAGVNVLYANQNDSWVPVGSATSFTSLDDVPPSTYELSPGTIWQSANGKVYVWDPGVPQPDWTYYYPDRYEFPLAYYENPFLTSEGFYSYEPENLFIFEPTYNDGSFYVYNTILDDEGFHVVTPGVRTPDWYEIEFNSDALRDSSWTPAYAQNLYITVDGAEVPNFYYTTNYQVSWAIIGDSLQITYKALTPDGEFNVPEIVILSRNSAGVRLDVTNDFIQKDDNVSVLPYNEIGVLNNFRGVWGNKGGARSMDLCFDALDIHGFNEREALWLAPISRPVDFNYLLSLVSANQVYVGDAPPSVSREGDLYYNNETGALSLYYVDEDRKQWWVEVDLPTLPSPFVPAKPVLSTGGCILNNGDMWKDPVTEGITIFYESPGDENPYDSIPGDWVQVNWEYNFSETPDPVPDYNSVQVYIGDYPNAVVPLTPGVEYIADNFTCSYTIDEETCSFIFNYNATTDLGLQELPDWWVSSQAAPTYPYQKISNYVYSDLRFVQAACVQNAESTLRPWKNQDLEVTTELELGEEVYYNPLIADDNKGPGDNDFLKSFIRLPSEYGRKSKKWQQTQLVMQDMAYFGSYHKLYSMRCPNIVQEPDIYEKVFFYGNDPTGKLLYSEAYLYSDAEGFNDPDILLPERDLHGAEYQDADFDFGRDLLYDSWDEASLSQYSPLHYRQTDSSGSWEGIYVQPQGNQPLSGFVEEDLAGKSVTPATPPVWDASIYKYAPLCPFGPETYTEDANNFKVNYAYFTADLAAAEDGFFDPQADVAWREPVTKGQTLYITNS